MQFGRVIGDAIDDALEVIENLNAMSHWLLWKLAMTKVQKYIRTDSKLIRMIFIHCFQHFCST